MSTVTQLMTAEELLHLPSDGFRYELVQGELKQMTPAGSEHGGRGMRLSWRLAQFVEVNGLGWVFLAETGFKIATDPDTVRAPDLAFVRSERIPESGLPRGYFPGAPDLAVEVVSPGDTVYEVEEKIEEWLAAGAQLVWIVNPRRRTVTVHRSDREERTLHETDVLEGEDVVPGFTLRVAEIFV